MVDFGALCEVDNERDITLFFTLKEGVIIPDTH